MSLPSLFQSPTIGRSPGSPIGLVTHENVEVRGLNVPVSSMLLLSQSPISGVILGRLIVLKLEGL